MILFFDLLIEFFRISFVVGVYDIVDLLFCICVRAFVLVELVLNKIRYVQINENVEFPLLFSFFSFFSFFLLN